MDHRRHMNSSIRLQEKTSHTIPRERELYTLRRSEKEKKKMKGFHCCLLLILALVGSLENLNLVCSAADPTDGFTPVPLTEANFELQKPYNIPLNERYSYEDGVRHMWVYATDKPHDPNSRTQPRTEVRMKGLDYTSGVWQFEGYGFVPNGTSGVTVAQIHGAAEDASTLILRIYDGNLRYYSGDLVATGLYDRWFRLNIIHDVDGDWVTVYVDSEQKYSTKGRGPGDFYFKCGVYAAPRNITSVPASSVFCQCQL